MVVLHAFYVVKSIISLLLACNFVIIWLVNNTTLPQKKNTYSAFLILKERRNQTREARAFSLMKNSKSVHLPLPRINKNENPKMEKNSGCRKICLKLQVKTTTSLYPRCQIFPKFYVFSSKRTQKYPAEVSKKNIGLKKIPKYPTVRS